MATRWAARVAYALVLLVSAQFAGAQTPPQTSDEALRAMEQMAGVIFSGQVTAVRRQVGTNGATGVVEVDFAVDDAVLGVSGSSYAMREWAGLWAGGDEPFRVGQRFLMLLYAPSVAGLSSPVGGMDGAIPVRGSGPAPIFASGFLNTISAQDVVGGAPVLGDGLVVDLRWVQTRVVRPISYRAESAANPVGLVMGVRANAAEAANAAVAQSTFRSAASVSGILASLSDVAMTAAAQSEPYATVLGKLRGWAREDNASR
jgi:hypothetical protein